MTKEATNLKILHLFYVKANNVVAILEAFTKISSELHVSAEVFGVKCTQRIYYARGIKQLRYRRM